MSGYWAAAMPNAHSLLRSVWFINLAFLVFNLLPIYPLDGGQILRSLLWFVVGRARSQIDFASTSSLRIMEEAESQVEMQGV